MKINPLEWNQVDETTFEAQGLLLLRSAQPFALTVETLGVEVSVGADTSHRIPLPERSKVTIIGGSARVFRKEPPPRYVVSNEETFTNIDRLPQESGTMLEVTKAVRLMKLEERAMIRRIREERQITDAVIAARKARKEAPGVPPVPKGDDGDVLEDDDDKGKPKAKGEAKPKADAE